MSQPAETNRADLPHRVGPWATRFDSDAALAKADDVAREYAVKHRDLNPILTFTQVYGPGLHANTATAIGISPVAPVKEDGSPNYTRGDFMGGLVYAVYRPADTASPEGPSDGEELWNTTLYPYPAGRLDPLTVPLAALGLDDVPGVDRRFVNFCAGALGVEAVDDLGMLQPTFELAWPDYRECVANGLRHLMANRTVSPELWYGLTYVSFASVEDLTLYLAQVYAYLFDGFGSMPVAPE